MTKPKHAWMVRAGDDNELADLVEEKNTVAIGWMDMGDLTDLEDTHTPPRLRETDRRRARADAGHPISPSGLTTKARRTYNNHRNELRHFASKERKEIDEGQA